MKSFATLCLLLLGIGSASAQSLDCAALRNSAGVEPEGYAEQCGGVVQPRTAAPVPSAPTDTGFTIDIRGQAPRVANTLYSFVLNAFATQTARGVTQPSVFGMDFNPAGTTLFAATGSAATPNPSSFGTINTTTGAFTLIGPITGLTAGDSVTDLVINPSTGVAFLGAAGGTPASTRLYSFNLTTGAATVIGPITAPTDATGTLMIDLAINCAGQMYAHNISDDALYTVNTATGAGTFIGGHGLSANFAQGMDFDAQDGTLYGFIYTGTGTNRFGTFNLTTGAFTTLVQDNPLGEYEGAIPTTCPGPVNADVSITKTAQAGALSIGTPFTYTLVAANAGPAGATGVVVTDALPAQVTYVSNNCGATFAAGTLTWTIGALANAANQTCIVNVTVAQAGAISNTATVATTSTDPTPGNNTSTVALAGAPLTADVSITKTAQAGALTVGAPFTYTLAAANAGPAAAAGVVVTDVLPAQVTYVSNNCGATFAAGTLTWTIGALANAASQTCIVNVTVAQAGAISNTATVATTTTDPTPGNNTSSVTLGGAPVLADLSLSKTANFTPPLALNGTINYVLTAANAGPGAAAGVVVTDPLPPNTTFVSSTCGATVAGTTVTWTIGALAAGANATCTIVVRVTGLGALQNTATITSTTIDPVPGNNVGAILVPGVTPTGIGGDGPALPVPAASWQALLLLALGLMVGGMLLTRRS